MWDKIDISKAVTGLCANFVYKIIETLKNLISKLGNFGKKLKTLSYSEFIFLH
jgi:hypothetical protein